MENQTGINQSGVGQGAGQPYGAPQQTPNALPTSGMAVASLVLGIIGIATSFLPIINNASFFLGILGLIFGIVGIVGIKHGKKKGKGLSIAGIVLSVVAIVVVLITQSLFSAALDSAAGNIAGNTSAVSSAQQGQQEDADSNAVASTDTASEKYAVSIDDGALTTDYAGNQALLVTYTFTNNSDDEASFAVNVISKAFQNGVQLDTAIGAGGDPSASLNTIKPGATITVSQAYSITDMSPVTVEVSESFSLSNDLIAEKTFDLA